MAATASANDLFIMMLKLYTLCSHAQSFSHYCTATSLSLGYFYPQKTPGDGEPGDPHMNDHSFFGQPCQESYETITHNPGVLS